VYLDNNLRRSNSMLFPPYAIAGYLLWTLIIAGLILSDLLHMEEQVITFATAEARASWDKDQAFRRWATRHGGVYVKPDSRTPPNPYLAHLPNRDIETTDGMKLTLLNPAFMMRQMAQEYEEMYGVKGSITGQVLLNPINQADPWELATLKRFDAGEKEVIETADIDDQPYLRLMRPMIMEEGCVKCHGHLGFKEGDIRGGVSIAIPLTPYFNTLASNVRISYVAHGGIWLFGILGIGFVAVRSAQREKERQESDAALEASQADIRFQARMLEQMSEGVILTGNDASIIYANAGAERLFGYDKGEMTGQPVAIINHPDEKNPQEKADEILRILKQEGEWQGEIRNIKKDGASIWCHAIVSAFDHPVYGEVWLGVQRDITEHKAAEAEVQRLASIVKHSSDFIGFADLEGHAQFLNEAGRKMVGIESDEQFFSQRVIDFFPDEDREFVINEVIPRVMETGHWAGEINFRHFHSGEDIPVWYDMFRIDDPVSGEPINFATITRDIREKKKTDQELSVYREQLEELVEERTRELREAQDELVRKERLATLGQLTATVSHELRNPLGAMRPSLSIIEKVINKEDARANKAIEIVDRNIDRCDRIIDELLDFTRITELELHAVRIDEWLASVIDEQDIQAGIQVKKEFCLKDIELKVDADRLRRAVINVVDNACHAMLVNNQPGDVCDGSRLNIKTAASDGRIEISVTDNGSGVPEAIREKIFEPMFSTKGFGVGLGMPTVKQIMQQHGGGIEIESKEGEGTTVTLWLPMTAGGGMTT